MPYYAYLAFHEGTEVPGRWSSYKRDPIALIDFVRGRKDGRKRLEELCARHPDYLPAADTWRARIEHKHMETEDNRLIEQIKRDIRLRLATMSLERNNTRRLWARDPGAPAGCYRLDFYDANKILRDAIAQSGIWKPSNAA